jgi:hypothetical protein
LAQPFQETTISVCRDRPSLGERTPNGNLNLWQGFGVEPRAGSWDLMRDHILNILANGNERHARYIIAWIAWALQHPGDRPNVALVLKGGKGCGKGALLLALRMIFGAHGRQLTHEDHLVGKFNAKFRDCLYLFADEAVWAGDKAGESVLKGLITEDLEIEGKGLESVRWRNRLKITMAANADWVVPASKGERRYAVFECSDRYIEGQCSQGERLAYFDALFRERDNGGLEAMLHDLRAMDLGTWHPRQIIETKALRDQQKLSLNPYERWYFELLQDGKLPGLSSDPRVSSNDALFLRLSTSDKAKNLNREAMAMYLAAQACVGVVIRRGCRGRRFPPLVEARTKWVKEYGAHEWSTEVEWTN